MTLLEFEDSLETFAQDFLNGGDAGDYSIALIQLINDFYTTSIQKTKEELVTDMLNYVTSVRSRK
jgi:hypothetical protein